MHNIKYNKKERGVSLIITFFIMVIVLSVITVISTLLYGQIKITRNIANSVIAYYAAESGVEKVLYYDIQVLPAGISRGICAINTQVIGEYQNDDYCQVDQGDINKDRSIFCNNVKIVPLAGNSGECAVNNCINCKITFDTIIFADGPRTVKGYTVEATVKPGSIAGYSDFNISSVGENYGVKRALELDMTQETPEEAPE